MPVRNIRTMHVQACQSADVAFNMPGVIAAQNFDQVARTGPAALGSRVQFYDLQANLYAHLGDPAPGDPARLKYNSTVIDQLLGAGAAAPYLFTLRNQGLGVLLDQAIEQRAAAYFDKYKYSTQLKNVYQAYLPDVVSDLGTLIAALDGRFTDVTNKLNAEGLVGARLVKSKTTAPVLMMASSTIDPATAQSLNGSAEIDITDNNDNVLQKQKTQGYTASVPLRRDPGDNKWKVPGDAEIVTQSTTSESVVHPLLDTVLAYRQNRVSVRKEQIQSEALSLKLPTMVDAMGAEQKAMDLGIRTLQLNFAHTYLIAPLDGIITALYKDVGESVEAGEPALRIENDAVVFFVGKIRWRGPLWPGKAMKVNLVSVFEKEGMDRTLDAKVVSVRGHSSDNDEWDIVAEATNPDAGGGRKLLPLNYHLDPETDSVDFP